MWGRTTWANAEVSSHAPGLANQKRADIPCARAGCPPWENERVPRHGRYASASGRPSAPPLEGGPALATAARFLLPVAPTRAHPIGSRDATGGNTLVRCHERFRPSRPH